MHRWLTICCLVGGMFAETEARGGDLLTGRYAGPVDAEESASFFPTFSVVFRADGTIEWAMDGVWGATEEDLTVIFPALSGPGRYTFERSTRRLTVEGSWKGKVECLMINDLTCREFRFETVSAVAMPEELEHITGAVMGSAKYEFQGDTVWGMEPVTFRLVDQAPTGADGLRVYGISRDYRVGLLQAGQLLYVDRSYRYAQLPAELAGQLCVRTANDDKDRTSGWRLTVNRPVDVVVAQDTRYGTAPAWLKGWTASGETLRSDDGVTRRLWQRRFGRGEIALGGNRDAGMPQDLSMYLVVLLPARSGAQAWALYR